MKISVNEDFTVEVEASDTIELLKKKIQQQKGCLPYGQLLTFGGKKLLYGHSLCDYNIEEGSTIQLMLRLRDCPRFQPDFPDKTKHSQVCDCG